MIKGISSSLLLMFGLTTCIWYVMLK